MFFSLLFARLLSYFTFLSILLVTHTQWISSMGNKVEKSRLDQSILDKLIEDTGLEREVIIAWR